MQNDLQQTLDRYLPDIRSLPKGILAFEPFILRYDYISQAADVNISIPANVRLVVDEIVMTSVMRWKGGTTITILQYPFLTLGYKSFENVLIAQTFPTNSNAGLVPVVEPNSCFVSATQKLQFNRLPFIVESGTEFIFRTFNAYWQPILQADFTCNVTINCRQIF